jgi:serine/threonine-protein kinase
MTPERWKRTEELYHTARSLLPGERAAFLAEACPDDEALRRDVESLLNEPVSDDGFLAGPAHATTAHLIPDVAPTVTLGSALGAYHLQTLLGAGGMGEVYRARDATLGRDVAIKILPRAFTSDPDRLARFEREARMLAALNHPNVCAIYGLEEADGVRFLILELVEGETLEDRLADAARRQAERPGLPVRGALTIARQIAEALEVAHEKGIIHRDLKPANIKITPDGVVKVLDFGLAKTVGGEPSNPGLTRAPLQTRNGRREGPVIGTAAYMSPEQARGLAVDKRTDIWAFGCVLYEMLAGRLTFAGDTVSDTIAKILEREPDWSALPAETPQPVRRLLFRCLAKDHKQRLRDIGDARIDIDAIYEVLPSAILHTESDGRRNRRAIWLSRTAGFVLVAGLAAIAGWNLRSVPAVTVTRFTQPLPPGHTLNGSRGAHIVAISPDGTQIVYSGTPYGLYRRSMSELDVTAIPGTEGYEASGPVFSPDGRSIAFFTISDQTLKKIAVTGGAAQTLCPAAGPTGITWGPNGIVFGQGSRGVRKVSPDGGASEALVLVEAGEAAHGPQILPGGTHILFTLATGTAANRWDRAHIIVESLKTHERKVIIEGASDARYLPTGHLVYAISGSVYAVVFDRDKLEAIGERAPVIEGVRRAAGSATGAAAFSVSNNGALIYVPGPLAGAGSAPLDLALMDRKGEVKPLFLPPGPYAVPRVSPDGTRAAFQSDDGIESIIYTYDLSGASAMKRFTSGGNNRFPIWASNKAVAFQSDRGKDRAVWWQPLDGPAERLTTAEPGTSHAPESWFGDTLLYSVTKGSEESLWTLSLLDRTNARFGAARSSSSTGAVFSPDGRWVAYSSSERSTVTLYVEPFPSTGQLGHVLTAKVSDTPKHPRWSRDGKELFYNPNAGAFESVRIATEPFAFGNAVTLPRRLLFGPPGSRTSYDITPDGRVLGLITAGQKEHVRGSNNQIQVVLNWFESLKTKVPVR